MAKRIPSSPTSSAQSGATSDGAQQEKHALMHEDGDAETIGADPRLGRQGQGGGDAQGGSGGSGDSVGPGARSNAGGVEVPVRSPSQSGLIDWPDGTIGVDAAPTHSEADAMPLSGAAEPAAGRRGPEGGAPGSTAPHLQGRPQATAHGSVQGRSRGPSPADIALRDDVRKALVDAQDLDVSHVEVTVISGLALLTGYVPDRWMQHVVQTVVSKVPGVSGVDNRLHERRGKAMSRPGESQEGHKI